MGPLDSTMDIAVRPLTPTFYAAAADSVRTFDPLDSTLSEAWDNAEQMSALPAVGVALSIRAKAPSEAEWNKHRDLMHDLYIVKGYTLKDIQQKLLLEHGFNAKCQMYKKRFNKWGFEKNIKAVEKEQASATLDLATGSCTAPIYVKGKQIARHKVDRYLRDRRRRTKTNHGLVVDNPDNECNQAHQDYRSTRKVVTTKHGQDRHHQTRWRQSMLSTKQLLHASGSDVGEQFLWHTRTYYSRVFIPGRDYIALYAIYEEQALFYHLQNARDMLVEAPATLRMSRVMYLVEEACRVARTAIQYPSIGFLGRIISLFDHRWNAAPALKAEVLGYLCSVACNLYSDGHILAKVLMSFQQTKSVDLKDSHKRLLSDGVNSAVHYDSDADSKQIDRCRNVAKLFSMVGRHKEAFAILEDIQTLLDRTDARYWDCSFQRAHPARIVKGEKVAESILLSICDAYQDGSCKNVYTFCDACFTLARRYEKQNRWGESEMYYRNVVEVSDADVRDPLACKAIVSLDRLFHATGRVDKLKDLCREYTDFFREIDGGIQPTDDFSTEIQERDIQEIFDEEDGSGSGSKSNSSWTSVAEAGMNEGEVELEVKMSHHMNGGAEEPEIQIDGMPMEDFLWDQQILQPGYPLGFQDDALMCETSLPFSNQYEDPWFRDEAEMSIMQV